MTNFLTMKEEYSAYHIKEDTFIKVLSYDKETGATNVDIFYKVNNKYRSISQAELPKDIINVIATKPSEKLTKEEIEHFKKYIEKLSLSETIQEINKDKVIFGKILHNNYILSKSPIQDYYRVSMAIPNEFGIMVHTTPVISSLVPYVFADIFNIGNKFKHNIFLIDNNLFVQTFELKNRNMGIIFQFDANTDIKASITVVGIFGIEKDFTGKVKVLVTPEDLNFIKDMKTIVDEQMNFFIEKLELNKVE